MNQNWVTNMHSVGDDETLELALALSQAENKARLKSVRDEKANKELELSLSQAENEARLKADQDETKKMDHSLALSQAENEALSSVPAEVIVDKTLF